MVEAVLFGPTGAVVDGATIREIVDYDPITGAMRWANRLPKHYEHLSKPAHRANSFNKQFAGKPIALRVQLLNKEVTIQVTMTLMRRQVSAIRVAYAHFHGMFPEGGVIALNGDPFDTRACNLARPKDNWEAYASRNLLKTSDARQLPGMLRRKADGTHYGWTTPMAAE